MTVTLGLALLLQAISVVLLRHRLGKRWLRRPVVLLVLTSVVYLGVSPVLMAIPSVGKWDYYRQGVPTQYIDQATLVMAAGMLALTACYLLTRPERVMTAGGWRDAQLAAGVLDWRLLALACAPLAVLTYSGRGYASGSASGALTPVSTDLAGTFFVPLAVLASAGFLLRHGTRWFVVVLAAQSLLLAAAGERTPVLAAAVALGLVVRQAGMAIPARQVIASVILVLAAALAITGARTVSGRQVYQGDTGLSARATGLGSGLGAVTSVPTGSPGLVAQAAVRLDGTAFAGAIAQAKHLGQPPLSASGVPQSWLITVPSALWTAKLGSLAVTSPAQTELNAFGIQQVNFLPGLSGLYYGFLSPAWLIAFLGMLGVLAGAAERWVLRRVTPTRLVTLAGAVIMDAGFEAGMPGMLIALRATLAVAVVITCAGVILGTSRKLSPAAG